MTIADTNWTYLLTVISLTIGGMATLIKIFSNPYKKEDMPGNNLNCKYHSEHLSKIEEATKENTKKIDESIKENSQKTVELTQIANDLSKEVGILKNQSENMEKSIDEMKVANKEVAYRLDNLLKQLIEWMNK